MGLIENSTMRGGIYIPATPEYEEAFLTIINQGPHGWVAALSSGTSFLETSGRGPTPCQAVITLAATPAAAPYRGLLAHGIQGE